MNLERIYSFKKNDFLYFGLCKILVAVQASSPAAASGAALVAEPGPRWLRLWTPEHRRSSRGTWALLLCGTWGFLGRGIEPTSCALAGESFTTCIDG